MPVRMTLLSLMLAMLFSCKTTRVGEENGPSLGAIRFASSDPKPESTVLDSRLKELERLAVEYPKRSDLAFKIADVWYQKENYRASAKSLERAIDIDPNEVKYHYHLGRVYLSMRELDLAEKEFRRAIDLMPVDRYTGPHGALGYVLCQKGRWAEALREFETCVRIDSEEPNSYFYLGCIQDMLKNGDAAVINLKKYLELGGTGFRPKTVEILASYGIGVRGAETELGDSSPTAPAGAGAPPKTASPGKRPADFDGLPGLLPDGPIAPPAGRAPSSPK